MKRFLHRLLLAILFFTPALAERAGAQVVFTETFDNAWSALNVPTASWTSSVGASDAKAWHRNDVTTNWTLPTGGNPNASGAAGTSYYARFHSYGISSGSADLISPVVDLSAATGYALTFYYICESRVEIGYYFRKKKGVSGVILFCVRSKTDIPVLLCGGKVRNGTQIPLPAFQQQL